MNLVAIALKISFKCKGQHVAQTTIVRIEMFYISVVLAVVESCPTYKGHFIYLLGHILYLAVTLRVASQSSLSRKGLLIVNTINIAISIMVRVVGQSILSVKGLLIVCIINIGTQIQHLGSSRPTFNFRQALKVA